MRFRGRELAHQELGMNVLMRVRDDLDEIAKVENISTNYARVRHARAEERLRAAYEKEKKDER